MHNMHPKFILILLLSQLILTFTAYSQRKIAVIDDRAKANLTLSSKKNPFYNIIYEGVTIGRKGVLIKAYRDTALKKIITSQEILKIGSSEETFQIYPDPTNPDIFYDTTVFVQFKPEKISRYLIVYEPIESEKEVHLKIIAIAPLIDNWVGGIKLNEQVMFWVKFDELAEIAGKEIFYGPDNPGGELTFKDFFERNLFQIQEYEPTIILTR